MPGQVFRQSSRHGQFGARFHGSVNRHQRILGTDDRDLRGRLRQVPQIGGRNGPAALWYAGGDRGRTRVVLIHRRSAELTEREK